MHFSLSIDSVYSTSKPGEKVVQLDVLAVRKRFRRSGVGKIVLDVSDSLFGVNGSGK